MFVRQASTLPAEPLALDTFLKPFPRYLCCPEESIGPSLESEVEEEASK